MKALNCIYKTALTGFYSELIDYTETKLVFNGIISSFRQQPPLELSYQQVREPMESPTFMEKLKHKFAIDKVSLSKLRIIKQTKTTTYHSIKQKKSDGDKSKKNADAKPLPPPRPHHQVVTKSKSNTSTSSSSSSSTTNSPSSAKRSSQPAISTNDDMAVTVTKRSKTTSVSDQRPRSVLVDAEIMSLDGKGKDKPSGGTTGKKGGIKNGFSGLIAKTTKWSPEKSVDSEKPYVPPRGKSMTNLSATANNDIVAEI